MNKFTIGIALVATICGAAVFAASNQVSVTETGQKRCVTSNGIPDHATGTFPNRGNPNRISAQSIKFCVDATPTKGTNPKRAQTIGIAKNGIIIRPGTAEWFDAKSPRGFSRDRSSGWSVDGMGAAEMLGIDQNSAHVDHNGIYHYHGMPKALIETTEETLLGWAADGFEIHYVGSNAKSSYMLLPGVRNSGPGGSYDGTYNEDWEFTGGYGNLDQCNGATVDGKYVYFATDAYPFFPHCLFGTNITQFR